MDPQSFFYHRSLGAGYCFHQDGTIRELVASFVHFSSRVVLAMITNSVVMLLNLFWITRLIDSALGPVLMSAEIQNPEACSALLCIDRLRTNDKRAFKFLLHSWTVLSSLAVVMWVIARAVNGDGKTPNHRQESQLKSRGFSKRIFDPSFALVKFLWLALTMLFFVLSVAIQHRGDSMELYYDIESGVVLIIGLVAIMTVIFSNLSHTAGYDALSMFVLPLAGLALVLALVFSCGLIVAARVHSHLVEAATNTTGLSTSPPADLLQHMHDAMQNATERMYQDEATAASAGLGFGEVDKLSSWLSAVKTFLCTLWNEKPWSASTWRQLDWICSGLTFLLTLLYDRIHDALTSVYRNGLATSFHLPRSNPRRTFSSLLDQNANDKYATPIWLCNAVLNDVYYAAGLMGQLAFSYCPFLFSPFGMGCQATGFGLFRKTVQTAPEQGARAWADPTVEFGMSVSAAAMTPAMGPMQKLIPGARLIFNLAGANMGDVLHVRKPTHTVLYFIWLFAGLIFLADALPFTGNNRYVRQFLPGLLLATSDHMRGWAWLFASFALLSIPLYKIAGLPGSEDIMHSKYIRMLFQSFGYVDEIEPSGYTATSSPKVGTVPVERIPSSYGSPDFVSRPSEEGTVFPRVHAPNVGISDGGHFENLGVFQLLLRRVPRIFAFDAGDADLSFGRTWARYDDLVTLFSSGVRDWMQEYGVRIELTSIMAYSVWDRGTDPKPLFRSTDFQEALRLVEAEEFNQPASRTTQQGLPKSVLRRQARCLVVRFNYLPLPQETDANPIPGILIYSKLQLLGLDAQLADLPCGPSIAGTSNWPLVPTSNQFISQMTYIKWMLLAEQAAREAAILMQYHIAERLPDNMLAAKPVTRGAANLLPHPRMWPMRFEHPFSEFDTETEYSAYVKRRRNLLDRLRQPLIPPHIILLITVLAFPLLCLLFIGAWYPILWLGMLLTWIAYCFVNISLLHAKAITEKAHEYEPFRYPKNKNEEKQTKKETEESIALVNQEDMETTEPVVPYLFVYGVLLMGALLSIGLPPMAQVASQLFPSTPLFNLTAPMPLLLDCQSNPVPLSCSVIQLEKSNPPLMHELFHVGEEIAARLSDIERNSREDGVSPQTKAWWQHVLSDEVDEAPLVCLHLLRNSINVPAGNISAMIHEPHHAFDLCSRGESYLRSRAELLSPMYIHGFNFHLVQQEHAFGSHQISPILFILLVMYLFGQAWYIARDDFARRRAMRKGQNWASVDKFQQEADELDSRNARKLLLGTLALVLFVVPLDQTLHLLQCYYQRHSIVAKKLAGDASGMLLLFNKSSIATEYGLFLLELGALFFNLFRPRLRSDRSSEGPLGHLVRLLGDVYTNTVIFCVPTYWCVRVQLEIDAQPTAYFFDYWNFAASPSNLFSWAPSEFSNIDVNRKPTSFLVAVRVLAPLLVLLLMLLRMCFFISEKDLWSAVRRGFSGPLEWEVASIKHLLRNFCDPSKTEDATTPRALPPSFLEVIDSSDLVSDAVIAEWKRGRRSRHLLQSRFIRVLLKLVGREYEEVQVEPQAQPVAVAEHKREE
jgi:hypothetical protein